MYLAFSFMCCDQVYSVRMQGLRRDEQPDATIQQQRACEGGVKKTEGTESTLHRPRMNDILSDAE